MAYSNLAWTIYAALETVLTASIKNLYVRNVYRFPTDEDTQEHLGKHKRAALFRLDSDAFQDQASDCREYEYNFQVQVIVIDPDEDQRDLMDLCEEVKYTLYGTQTNSTNWHNLIVDPVQYLDAESETNTKAAEFSLRVYNRG